MKQLLKSFGQACAALDKLLLLAVTLLSGLSVVLLYSIYQNGISDKVQASNYQTQLAALLIGLVCCLILTSIDYHKLVKLWFIYVPISLGLVFLTFTSLGYGRAGADDVAWLDLGFISIQPSEFLKLSFLLTFSYHLSKDEEHMNKPLHMLLICLHAAVPIALVAMQGDYGTAIVFCAMFAAMLFSCGIAVWYLLAALVAVPIGCWALWNFVLGSSHKRRIEVLIHPGTDPLGIEYQQDLGLKALGSGQLFGKGLFGGDYVAVPEVQNDFIFSYIGQVFGFVGAIAVLVILCFLCLKILGNCGRAKDKLGRLICIGGFAVLFSHCFLNIGMVLKVMPVIGVPLPFLSAGGTAMLSMYLMIGLVMSTYVHNEKQYRVFYDIE